jgi:hypothetical protein
MPASIQLILLAGPDWDGDALADDLLSLVNASEDVKAASRETDGSGKQDAGVIIGVILASASVTALARGIADWIRSKNGVKVKVSCPDGTMIAVETIDGTTAVAVIEQALKYCQEKHP